MAQGVAGQIERLAVFSRDALGGNRSPQGTLQCQLPLGRVMANARFAAGRQLEPGAIADAIQRVEQNRGSAGVHHHRSGQRHDIADLGPS